MDTTGNAPNLIVDLSFNFAVQIVKFCDVLVADSKFVIANQLIKSGTSVGANVREAKGAESRKDFIHKLRISYKEAEETAYWLELLQAVYHYQQTVELLKQIISIKKVINKIISSTRDNQSTH